MELLQQKSDFQTRIKDKKPVLVDFYTKDCEPCKWLDTILERVSENLEHQLEIMKIDVDRHPEFATQFNIKSVPTLILFTEGNITWQMAGFDTAEVMTQVLRTHI